MAENNDVRLRGTVPDMKHQDLNVFWEKCAEIRQRKGLLELKDTVPNVDDDFIKTGLMLIIDGSDPELVKNILEGRMKNALMDIENKYRKSMCALLFLQKFTAPLCMKELMSSYE